MAQSDGVPERSRIVDSALDQMAQGGLKSVTNRALASRLGTSSDAIETAFPEHWQLHDAMAAQLLASAWEPLTGDYNWQEWLRARARNCRRILLGHRDAPQLAAGAHLANGTADPQGALRFLGSGFSAQRTQDAMLMIDRFAIGWSLEESAAIARGTAVSRTSRDAEFEFGLEVLIAGLGAVGQQVPQGTLRMRRRMVTMGIWALLRHVRQSADLAYERLMELGELDRRLLMEVHAGTVTRSSDLISMSGLDKAQVSRAVRRLTGEGLLERDHVRGPFRLTHRGEHLAGEFARIARIRNAELIGGIDAAELQDFSALVSDMTARAVLLLEQEQSFDGQDIAGPGPDDVGAIVPSGRSELVLPPLSTLFSYMKRSGSLMIRRLADLSSFEWQVLSAVGEFGPLTPVKLIATVERDHSQARRTLRTLIEAQLVESYSLPGQRGALLRITEPGREIARRLNDEGWRRDTILFGSIEPDRLERFKAVLAKLTANALAELERQRRTDR